MKQQNIEIQEETFAWYSSNFPSARQGVSIAVSAFHDALNSHPVAKMFSDPLTAHGFMLDVWKQAWRHSLVSMKGLFTDRELSLLIDTHNGLMLSAHHYDSNTLAVGTSDSIALDGMDQKWKIDAGQILDKIRSLTPMQSICLEIWSTGFWYGQDADREDRSLAEYIKTLL